jgi:hypothetical protein
MPRDLRDKHKRPWTTWEDREESFERRPFWESLKWILGGTAIFLIVVAFVGLASTGSVFFKGEAAKLTNPAREKAIIFDPNRTLSTYESFYDTCTAYNAALLNAQDAKAEAARRRESYSPESDPFGNEQRAISALSEAARSQRNIARHLAGLYNADAAKNSRGPFRASDLPYNLDATSTQSAQCGTPKESTR